MDHVNELNQLLDAQQSLLEQLLAAMAAERAALIAQNASELMTIAEHKSSALLRLKQNDDVMAAHPGHSLLTNDNALAAKVASVQHTLARCKQENEANAQLIEHSQASINRLAQALQVSRNASSLTYTDKGKTSTISTLGSSIEV
ncbi:flagellar protein FlgN [Shewanella zhangzhouensis]|uniref:flagellar protein FlgN n=1 Tax=Shewanella zhangzhouensis TaxID=2864213 RepID=UPI001C65696B|nr:flagellar protein FlgN [Shewanella zhangzhouensis]QYK03984.1 flagellar protein FlgN [Shewanella zhangzhouensis]